MPTYPKMITIERHIADQEHLHQEATGEFSRLLRDLTLAVRVITREVRRAGLADILGLTGGENVHGEAVKKLDEFSNETIVRAMRYGGNLCAMASEESDGLIQIPAAADKGSYVLLFDPLDGSSNIDVNAPVGTIFSILRRVSDDDGSDGCMDDMLQAGYRQCAAGYALYGSSTVLAYTTGEGVDFFTYDPTLGEFLLSSSQVRIPKKGKYYSINEGNSVNWFPGTRRYVDYLKQEDQDSERPYSLRYIGTAVADIHRTLLYGGIFLYPADKKSPNGKLRLMYEVNPLGMLIEQAGGAAIDGRNRVLELVPTELHQRAPFVCGSVDDVEMARSFMEEDYAGLNGEPAKA
ncbi:MAG: class 1 fructose-bisphosphatase [Candidatus Kapaibacterium sp.]